MESTTRSSISLTNAQAARAINVFYTNHWDYSSNTPLPDTYQGNVATLLKMLTMPIGTPFKIITKYSKQPRVGFTKITCNDRLFLIGFRDETRRHTQLVHLFAAARSFSWFVSKLKEKRFENQIPVLSPTQPILHS